MVEGAVGAADVDRVPLVAAIVVAGLRGVGVAGLRGVEAAGLRGFAATGLRGVGAADFAARPTRTFFGFIDAALRGVAVACFATLFECAGVRGMETFIEESGWALLRRGRVAVGRYCGGANSARRRGTM